MKYTILRLEETASCQGAFHRCRTVFKTRHGRTLYLSLELSGEVCTIVDCFYVDRGQGRPRRLLTPKKLNTRHFPADNLLEVIASELDKVFYGVEYVQTETADMPLADYLYYKAKETDCKYRFLILVGEGGQCPNGLPMKLHTRLKNKLHRSIYLELDYYDDDKEGRGVVKQCYYYDRQYRKRMTAVSPPTLVSCFFPYTREGILTLVNQELCCDFTHILVTEGIDLDSNTTPLCGAI